MPNFVFKTCYKQVLLGVLRDNKRYKLSLLIKIMTKPTVLSIKREDKRTEIKFKKDADFINLYLDIIDFLKIDFDYQDYSRQGTKKEAIKKLLSEEDELHCYKSNFTLEIFFGHKKALVIFESDKKLQQKFIDKVISKSKFLRWKKI